MTYDETVEFIYSRLPAWHRTGKAAYKNSLYNTERLDSYFGHPHRAYPTIHVGGTNGKGSVSYMMASVLQQAGYRTGLYTSPHLKDFRERIRVNGEMIGREHVVSFVGSHREIIESLRPSFFELTVAMAFEYFAIKRVDVAVIEVGLGGRLDSTNIISPAVSVITNIGHDHMDILGNTPEKIAAEKAGIIKHGTPVVIGETTPATHRVFTGAARRQEAEIFFAAENYGSLLGDFDILSPARTYTVTEHATRKIFRGTVPLAGDYQQANLKTVFQTWRCLEKKLAITEQSLTGGIANVTVNTGLQGRWQTLGNSPLVICDTGHNIEGIEYVSRQLERIASDKRRLHLVLGFANDKDVDKILPLFPRNAVYYFTKAAIPRAMDENTLKAKALAAGLHAYSFQSVREAFASALTASGETDIIFIGGSFFIVAEVL
ncbi:MAG: bifunctional folylpolyglutamate synthase/dihydrofolate synthase [Bacteroidales bacterium]|jgi:dihydrofolate synthase/folylpolyglutamate synthase|nr:bifunctional folylpolyglutamate synthase/dihydrofolate synthase [Bacteroidales bacterium]